MGLQILFALAEKSNCITVYVFFFLRKRNEFHQSHSCFLLVSWKSFSSSSYFRLFYRFDIQTLIVVFSICWKV